MKTRIISGIVLLGLLISTLVIGNWYLYFVCLTVSFIGLFELYRVFEMEASMPAWIGYASTLALYISLKLGLGFHFEIFIITACLIALLTAYVLMYPRLHASNIMAAIFGVVYVSLMISFIFRLRISAGGATTVWLIFLGSWVNDTCAYFTGYFAGKHKMAPELSPKKTIEGAIGGIAGSTIVGLIYGIIVNAVGTELHGNVILIFTLTGLIGAFGGIIGDLAASAIKRNRNIKDYGKLIPGHGGILDRFDSVILTAPIVYWIVFFMGIR